MAGRLAARCGRHPELRGSMAAKLPHLPRGTPLHLPCDAAEQRGGRPLLSGGARLLQRWSRGAHPTVDLAGLPRGRSRSDAMPEQRRPELRPPPPLPVAATGGGFGHGGEGGGLPTEDLGTTERGAGRRRRIRAIPARQRSRRQVRRQSVRLLTARHGRARQQGSRRDRPWIARLAAVTASRSPARSRRLACRCFSPPPVTRMLRLLCFGREKRAEGEQREQLVHARKKEEN
ncbi:unnamed protein product [Urochloa humidicola]